MAEQGLQTTGETAIESEAKNKVFALMKKYEKSLSKVLPKHLDAERMQWLVVNSVRKTPELAGCTPASFLNSVMLAANLGLEIRDRSAYLIPFGSECQLMIDYRGKLELARRAGVGSVHLELIRAADPWHYRVTQKGPDFRHDPQVLKTVIERGEIVAGYMIADLGKKIPQLCVVPLEKIEERRRRSKKGCKHLTLADIRKLNAIDLPFRDRNRTPWTTDYDAMAMKTVAHIACNLLPQTPDLMLSQQIDDANDTENVRIPVVPQLQPFMLELDPADDKPMVDGGGATREEQKVAQGIALDEQLRKNARHVADLPDPLEVQDEYLEYRGNLYRRNADNTAWAKVE